MSEKDFESHWKQIAIGIAKGDTFLNESDLLAIGDNIGVLFIDPSCLPGVTSILGCAESKKDNIFLLAEKLFGIAPETWLIKENTWLKEGREVIGSSKTGGKDNLKDVVSAEIIVRLISAAWLLKSLKQDEEMDGAGKALIAREVVCAVNVMLYEACSKGRTRMQKVDDCSVYAWLRTNGVAIGLGGSKFLPYPEKSLPVLFLMLTKKFLLPEAYL